MQLLSDFNLIGNYRLIDLVRAGMRLMGRWELLNVVKYGLKVHYDVL